MILEREQAVYLLDVLVHVLMEPRRKYFARVRFDDRHRRLPKGLEAS